MRGKWTHALVIGLSLCLGCGGQLGWNKKAPAKAQGYEAVKVGMTEKEVVALLGMPQKRQLVQGGEGGETYIVMRWLVPNHIITINVQYGVVAGKQRI